MTTTLLTVACSLRLAHTFAYKQCHGFRRQRMRLRCSRCRCRCRRKARQNTLTTPSPLQWARVASCFASDRYLNPTLPLARRLQACQLQHQRCAAPRRAGALAPSNARAPWCVVHGCRQRPVMTRVGIPDAVTAPALPPVSMVRVALTQVPQQPLVVTTTLLL